MVNIKHLKERASNNFKEHYVLFIVICLIASITGAAYSDSFTGLETKFYDTKQEVETIKDEDLTTTFGKISADDIVDYILDGKLESAKNNQDQTKEEKRFGAMSLGAGKGVLSSAINKIQSGQIILTVYKTIVSVTKSNSLIKDICLVLAAMFYLSATIFVKNTYNVAFRRIYLESYRYEKVKVNRFLFLFRVKKVFRASFVIFLAWVYEFLWNLTIVGGLIKHYSYKMVPYIVAENPTIKANEAITLSRKMMDGHKFECFLIDLSFIGWYILAALTLNISAVLFSNPYIECTYTEYYVYIRSLSHKKNVENIDLLNDYYLYYKADEKLIKDVYKDIYEIIEDDIHIEDHIHTGFRGFVENYLGVIYKYDEEEDAYNTAIEQEVKINDFKYILALKAYPGRLFPMPQNEKNPRLEHVHYLRHYSIWSLFALFFIFAFIGWSWEVLLHIVNDGVFVNRGVLHGPWLPIYGFGGFFIIMILSPLRKKPVEHTLASIVLCGVLEYFTSYFLELTKNTKWWDYTGYFFNINGRICAEGLIVFALGGAAIVYALAPIIDNQLRKVNQKSLKVVTIILIIAISIDAVYSNFNPNTGKGITDYGQEAVVERIDEQL